MREKAEWYVNCGLLKCSRRLNKHFTMNWHADLIKASTPELFKQQESALNKAELISINLVSPNATRFIPSGYSRQRCTAQLPLRYIEMEIESKKEWRLLTFQEYDLRVKAEDLLDAK